MTGRKRATVVCRTCRRELAGVRIAAEEPTEIGWRVRAHRVNARGGQWCNGNYYADHEPALSEAAIIRQHQEKTT